MFSEDGPKVEGRGFNCESCWARGGRVLMSHPMHRCSQAERGFPLTENNPHALSSIIDCTLYANRLICQ